MRLGSSSTENKNKLVGTPFFRVPLTIALVYTLAGFLWIMFSDILVERLAANEPTYHALQTLKGWFFVAVNGIILFFVLRGVYRHILDAYRSAASSEQRLELALTNVKAGVWDRDLTRKNSAYISTQIKELVGIPADRPMTLSDWQARVHPHDIGAITASIKKAIAARGEISHDVRYRFRNENGEYLRLHSRGRVICDEKGNPLRLVGIVFDETAQSQAAERINQLIAYDALTGLANRNTFITQLDRMLAQAANEGKHVAVAQILIHDFNELFDEYGNDFTNKIIQVIGKQLSQLVEPTGLTCRLEHDCFAIAVPYRQDSNRAHKTIKFIANLLDRPITIQKRKIKLSYSIGSATSPQDGDTANLLIANSHRALAKHGSEGRDTIHWFTEGMDVELRQRIQLLRELREAMDNDEVECHYQPIVDLKAGNTIGFEALARWHRSGVGMVPPNRFIPLAEETGYIRVLGERVLRKACSQAAQWECIDGSEPFVSVNVSQRQIDDPNFPALVRDVLDESGLPPSRLELEITEASVAQDSEAARQRLLALRELGVSIALDDFGTGFSSLASLSFLPFNRLKIDRSFTREYGRSVRATEIANAILVLSRALGLSVTVEGVETLLQSSALHAADVDAVQGFYFSRAVPAKEVRELLERNWSPIIHAEENNEEYHGLRA